MNLEALQTALKRYGFDETDPLTAWLNAAMHDIENDFDWPWLESASTKISPVAGTSALPLPQKVLKIISVRDVTNSKILTYMDRRQFQRDIEEPAERGPAPEVFTLNGLETVQIYPVLSVAISMEIFYQTTTDDMAIPTDEPKTGSIVWPLLSHYLIVLKAASIALLAEDEPEKSKAVKEEYEKSLEKLRKKFGERELGEPSTVQDVQGYGDTLRGY